MTRTTKKEEAQQKRQGIFNAFKNLTPEQKQELVENCIILTIDGKQLSGNNTAFLAFQNGKNIPTVVGGYRQWQSINRQVKKGEVGSYIFVPRISKSDDKEHDECKGFNMVSVFDISQTEPFENQDDNSLENNK